MQTRTYQPLLFLTLPHVAPSKARFTVVSEQNEELCAKLRDEQRANEMRVFARIDRALHRGE